MVKIQRGKSAKNEATDRRQQDIGGLLLCFIGLASLLCLGWPQHALLPDGVDAALRLLAGVGAYVIPVLLIFIGGMLLVGFGRLSLTHSSWGSLTLFLVFVTWRHLLGIAPGAAWDGPAVSRAGGALGWLVGVPLRSLLGGPISYMFLVLASLVAVVLLVDQPIIEIVRRLHEKGKVGAQKLTEGVASRVPRLPEKSEAGIAASKKAMATAVVATPEERQARATRVAERSLVGSKTALIAPALPDEDAVGNENNAPDNSATSKLLRMFNLTRGLRQDDAETDEAPTVPTPVEKKAAEREARLARAAKTDTDGAKASEVAELTVTAPPDKAGQTALVFVLPPLSLLKESPPATSKRSPSELTDNIRILEQTLEQFNIGANVVEVASGPSVTRYEIQLAPGIKVSKIVSLADNIAMNLAAIDVRVEAPIPGKAAIGVEVPNATPVMVSLRECLDTDEYRNAPSKLTIALGKDVAGQYKYADLTRMPHLLIGGSTNSGKSVCLNALIASLVYRATPREVRLLMIDPKRVELSLWDGIPHLMHPVVKDVKQASGIFRAALKEMDRRYDTFAALGTRNLEGYNARVPETEKLPYIVLIVDELADLMMQQGPEIETSICRLAQLARATGIHLVIATQRPSVDIITGTIKANISSRIAFAVASQVDSRTILDMSGADRLIGRGDMLFMPIDAPKPVRIQGCYLSESETNALVEYLKEQEKPTFTVTLADAGGSNSGEGGRSGGQAEEDVDDQFFEQAVRLVVNNGQASTSMLQRRFRIGYTRAARIVEMMEERGIVGPLNGAKPRELLVSKDEVERMFNPGGAIPSVEDYEDEE